MARNLKIKYSQTKYSTLKKISALDKMLKIKNSQNIKCSHL